MWRKLLLLSVSVLVLSWAAVPLASAFEAEIFYNPRPAYIFHIVLVWLVTPFALWILLPAYSPLLLWSVAMLGGGASSNLLWRLMIGPVPDYIPFPFGAYGNIADLMIFIGIPLYFAIMLVHVKNIFKGSTLQ